MTATVGTAIEVLNRIHHADPTVLPALIEHRVPCNQAVADDPMVQAGSRSVAPESNDPPYEVGFLGILNGIFGIDERGWGHIAANYDTTTGRLIEFVVMQSDPNA